jgi:hypothetical protein
MGKRIGKKRCSEWSYNMDTRKHLIVVGLQRLRNIAPKLEAMRICLGMENDLSTDIDHLLSLNDRMSRRPVSVLFYNDDSTLAAAVLFFERCLYRLPTGVLRAGDHAGDGAVIAPPGLRSATLMNAIDILLKDWRFHSIFGAVSHTEGESRSSLQNPDMSDWVTAREVRRRLRLANEYDETIDSVGRNMRRGIRNKRTDIDWISEMSPDEALDAMLYLKEHCSHGRTRWEIFRRYDFLRKHPKDGFALGIRDKSGQWMSFITGWRSGGVTYVPWAMHDQRLAYHSLSTVIYSYLIEHEVALGQRFIEWVGGVTERWSQVCESEECICITRIRPSFRSSGIQWLASRMQWQTALGYYQNELQGDCEEDIPETVFQEPIPDLVQATALQAQSLTGSLR